MCNAIHRRVGGLDNDIIVASKKDRKVDHSDFPCDVPHKFTNSIDDISLYLITMPHHYAKEQEIAPPQST